MSQKREKEHFNRIEQQAKKVQTIFYTAVREVSDVTQGIVPPFKYKDNPIIEGQVDKIIKKAGESLESLMDVSIKDEWMHSVNNNLDYVKRLAKKTKIAPEKLEEYENRNLEALEAFQKRKDNGGLTLSNRIWGLSKNLKGEFEMAIDNGLADGRGASELSRDIRKFLNRPDDLYRRVRSESGNLVQSQSSIKRIKAEGITYGQGMYRSSYKNAMRVARTEINNAYRMSDYEKRQQLDFVVGIEVKRSNRVYDCEVCASLAGKYPKDFKFTSWHPHCRCYSVSILSTDDEFVAQQKAILAGKEIDLSSENTVKDVPSGFRQYVEENKDRIAQSRGRGTEPWWMKDNNDVMDKVEAGKPLTEEFDFAKAEKEINTLERDLEHISEDLKDLRAEYDGEELKEMEDELREYQEQKRAELRGLKMQVESEKKAIRDIEKPKKERAEKPKKEKKEETEEEMLKRLEKKIVFVPRVGYLNTSEVHLILDEKGIDGLKAELSEVYKKTGKGKSFTQLGGNKLQQTIERLEPIAKEIKREEAILGRKVTLEEYMSGSWKKEVEKAWKAGLEDAYNLPPSKKGEVEKDLMKVIESNSNLRIRSVDASPNLDDKTKNEFKSAINGLFYEYNIDSKNDERSQVDLLFRGGSNYSGRVRSNYAGNILSIDFGSGTPLNEVNLDITKRYETGRYNIRTDLGKGKLGVIYHEFAHVIWVDSRTKRSPFLRELKDLRDEYTKEVKSLVDQGGTKWGGDSKQQKARERLGNIWISNYAHTNIDEFLAEGFAEFKLRSKTPSEYSVRIGKLVDKYYRKF